MPPSDWNTAQKIIMVVLMVGLVASGLISTLYASGVI